MEQSEIQELFANNYENFLGMKITEIKPGHSVCELPIRPEFINVIGSVHGGLYYTLADSAGGTAAFTHGNRITTVDGSLSFLRPAINTKKLVAVADELKYGKRICVYKISIYDENGTELAFGTFTYANLNQSAK